jgi:hypothetical protein
VAEVFYEKEFGQFETLSGLVGLIWQVNADIAVDVAVRHATMNVRPVDDAEGRRNVRFSGVAQWRHVALSHHVWMSAPVERHLR